MEWSFVDLPRCAVLWEERVLTLDGWNTQFAWRCEHDQEVRRWLEETSVTADSEREARARLAGALPSFVRRVEPEEAMMDFLRGTYHRDPASTLFGRGGGLAGLDRDIDPWMRTQRVTRRDGTPVSAEEIDETATGLRDVLQRIYRGLLRFIRGGS
ncbi:MAG: hypothetical protein R6U70_03435 [Bacillota bacterium]